MNTNFYIPETDHVKNAIHSIWQVEGVTRFQFENIIPKGIIEIIFNFSHNTIPIQLNNQEFCLANCFINGFNTSPVRLNLPEQHAFFGVRLQPLAVKKIIKIPGSEFLDLPVDLSLLDSTFHSLWHQLAEADTFERRVFIFRTWIEAKLVWLHPQEKLMNDFLCAVNQHDFSVTKLANALCYSPRQLSRKILEATGINTEEMLLYKKYLHSLHLMHNSELSLTEIAYHSNFSDQSHFIKSFKGYTKLTPGEYKRQKSFLKGHIYENVR